MFRKTIAVLLMFSIVLSSCGKKDKNKSNDFVRTASVDSQSSRETPVSSVPLYVEGERTYSIHCDKNQQSCLDSLVIGSSASVKDKCTPEHLKCLKFVLADISALKPSVWDSPPSSLNQTIESSCSVVDSKCFVFNSHKALSFNVSYFASPLRRWDAEKQLCFKPYKNKIVDYFMSCSSYTSQVACFNSFVESRVYGYNISKDFDTLTYSLVKSWVEDPIFVSSTKVLFALRERFGDKISIAIRGLGSFCTTFVTYGVNEVLTSIIGDRKYKSFRVSFIISGLVFFVSNFFIWN
jgi:hypothetical protein